MNVTTWSVKCECCGTVAVCHIIRGAALVCPACVKPGQS